MKIPHNYRTKNKNDLPELVRSLWTLFFVVVVVNLSKVFVVADVSFGIYRSIDCSVVRSIHWCWRLTWLFVSLGCLLDRRRCQVALPLESLLFSEFSFITFCGFAHWLFIVVVAVVVFAVSLGYFVNKFIHKTEIIHSLKRKRRRRRCGGGGGGCRWCILHFKDLRLAVLTILHKWRRARYYYAWVCV